MLGHLPEFLFTLPQGSLDLITFCDIHRDSTDQRQRPLLVNDGKFADHAFMQSIPVRSRFRSQDSAFGRNHPRIIRLELHGNGTWQDFLIRLALPDPRDEH